MFTLKFARFAGEWDDKMREKLLIFSTSVVFNGAMTMRVIVNISLIFNKFFEHTITLSYSVTILNLNVNLKT